MPHFSETQGGFWPLLKDISSLKMTQLLKVKAFFASTLNRSSCEYTFLSNFHFYNKITQHEIFLSL